MQARPSSNAVALILGLLFGAAAAIFSYPWLLSSIAKIEHRIEAEASFSSGLPAINVAWDDLKVFPHSSKDIPTPGQASPSTNWHVVISSNGEHHPDSRSSEVWVFGIETPERVAERNDVMTSGAAPWSITDDTRARNNTLYAATFGGKKALETTISGSRLKLKLLNHSFSGRVQITVNGTSEEVDLFAPHDGVIVNREYPTASISPSELVNGRLSFLIPSGQTYTDELHFSPVGDGVLTVLSATYDGVPLERLGPNRFSSPVMGRTVHLYAAACALVIFGLISGLVFTASLYLPQLRTQVQFVLPSNGRPVFPQALGLSALLCVWNLIVQSTTLAFVNVLPSLLAYWAVVAVGARITGVIRWLLIGSWIFLSYRFPLVDAHFSVLHALALGVFMCSTFVFLVSTAVDAFERKLLCIALVVIVGVSLLHLGILSPYTYAAIRPIWPDQYIAAIDGILTNGDLPHFTDLFQAYTNPSHKAGFSVVLRRFFYEYLWSTAWPTATNWGVGTIINLAFWFAAVVGLLNVTREVVRSARGKILVVIGGALSLGFASVVGQPVVYLAAYAWTSILLWLALSLIKARRFSEYELPFAFVGPAIATYDMLPICAAFVTGFLIQRRLLAAVIWIGVQIVVPAIWSGVILGEVLGTYGNPSNAAFLSNSIEAWKRAILSNDFLFVMTLVQRGLMNAVYAGFAVGLVVTPLLILGAPRGSSERWRSSAGAVVVFAGLLTLAYLAAGCVIAPELPRWSPGWQIPRYSYYYYPATLLALGIVADRLFKGFVPGVLFLLVMLVFADTLGHHKPAMLLHYGNWFGVFTKW